MCGHALKMKKPIVSIIIPVYNGSNYLDESIVSAITQSYENIEVLVINDGSNDNGKTEEIARGYGNRIRYYYKENGGVSTALNYGIKKMKGEYFIWLSHDDVLYKDSIKLLVEAAQKNNCMVVGGIVNTIDANGRPLDEIKLHIMEEQWLNGCITFWKTWIYACALLVHVDCLSSLGLFNENNYTTQDVEFILKILNRYKILFLSKSVVRRRVHLESGFYKNFDLNKKELDALLNDLLDKYGIDYFLEKESGKELRKRSMINQLNFIAKSTFHQANRFSVRCYRKSWVMYPSITNSAIYSLIVISFKYGRIRSIINEIFTRVR